MIRGNSGLKPKDNEMNSNPGMASQLSGSESIVLPAGEPRGLPKRIEHSHVLMREGGLLLLAWLLHYAPFYTMGRILYYHHYFPAMLFSSMLTGITFDILLKSTDLLIRRPYCDWLQRLGQMVLLFSILYSFYLFHPLSYGMKGPLAHEPGSAMAGLKWMDSWEF
ncbi:hypothetical protein KUCAC02_025521 [Chaenocephalus aceratus]|uniref:Uncharacterized protein n=1 Tax=Chaenocephalus aceratus TaxID=36190 RepID=A0ACB9VUS3_CHAAC|nr:hypothetical protein KUCAC02_025521 [Chaenocephalus aceratus]